MPIEYIFSDEFDIQDCGARDRCLKKRDVICPGFVDGECCFCEAIFIPREDKKYVLSLIERTAENVVIYIAKLKV